MGEDCPPCLAVKVAVPSVPQSWVIAPAPPGCLAIHCVRLKTLPSIATQQLEAVLFILTSAMVKPATTVSVGVGVGVGAAVGVGEGVGVAVGVGEGVGVAVAVAVAVAVGLGDASAVCCA